MTECLSRATVRGAALAALGFLASVSLAAAGPADAAAECVASEGEVTRKFNPGHYVAMNRFDDRGVLRRVVAPGIAGVQIRYRWAELEPSEGVYDFSGLAADLAAVAAQDAQLVVFLEDKSFDGEWPTPPYLREAHTLANRAGGYTAKRWDPYVVERMHRLVAALGRQFDCHPNFEGVAFQESSLSLDPPVRRAHDYSPEAYRDALVELLAGSAERLPRSRVFWYMNFLVERQRYIADVARAVAPHGVAMGGPDVLPDNAALAARTYPFYDRFAGRMPLFNSIQFDSYAHRRGEGQDAPYWTLEELFVFARDRLHVDYLFWNRKTWRKPEDSWNWDDAREVIAEHADFAGSAERDPLAALR